MMFASPQKDVFQLPARPKYRGRWQKKLQCHERLHSRDARLAQQDINNSLCDPDVEAVGDTTYEVEIYANSAILHYPHRV